MQTAQFLEIFKTLQQPIPKPSTPSTTHFYGVYQSSYPAPTRINGKTDLGFNGVVFLCLGFCPASQKDI